MSELETVMAKLPSEMWVAIARAGPGEMAFAMERVCQSWRCALVSAGDALWKPLTLARFPRIAGILRASLTGPPPYRERYRDQAKAEAAPAWLKGEPLPSLDEFIFSIEMEQAAVQPRGGEEAPPLAAPHDAARHLGAHSHESLRRHADAPVATERLNAPAIGAKLDQHHQQVDDDASNAEARRVHALMLRRAVAEQGPAPREATAATGETVL